MGKVALLNTLGSSKDLWRAHDNLFGVVSARGIMIVKRAAKDALAFNHGIVKNSNPSSDTFDVDLDEKADGSSGAQATLSRSFVEIKDENAFKKPVAHCVSVEGSVREQREIDRKGLDELF